MPPQPETATPEQVKRFLGCLLWSAVSLVMVVLIGWAGQWLYVYYVDSQHPYEIVNEPIVTEYDPDQRPLPRPMRAIIVNIDDWTYGAQPMVAYTLRGEVLYNDPINYWDVDVAGVFSPTDLTIGWGYTIEPRIKQYLEIGHGDRFAIWRIRDNAPPEVRNAMPYFITHLSNNHLIPADENIRYALLEAEVGDLVVLEGYLVYAYGKNNRTGTYCARWESSLVRNDHGDRGCEIMYVTSMRLNNRLYRSNFDPEEYYQ